MTAALALLLAAAAPATPRLAATGFSGVGIEAARAQFFSDYFADQLNAGGAVRVVTQSEMAAMLGVDRQKQLLGCNAETSCIAELAGALDAQGIIIGSVAKVGDEYAVQVKIIAPNSRILGLYSARVKSEPGVLDFLGESAKDLAAKLGASPSAKGSSRVWVIPAVIGGALLVASAVCLVLSGLTFARFNTGKPAYDDYAQLVSARSGAELQNKLGLVFLGIGLVAVAGGAVIGISGVFD